MQLELWKESIVITHGRTTPENPGNFYVNHKLTCASKVEKQYYKLGPDRCVHCGILIEDESISNQADELFKKYYNVRPSCKDCGETLFSNGRKKEHLGKRRRADQIGGEQKKQKVDSVTQQDLEDVRRAGEAAPHGNITDSWIKVMKSWWRKIRRSRN